MSIKTVGTEVDLDLDGFVEHQDVEVDTNGELANELLAVLVLLISLGFTLFTLQMLVFQIYLISAGLTTWEYLRWMKITYLKVWP